MKKEIKSKGWKYRLIPTDDNDTYIIEYQCKDTKDFLFVGTAPINDEAELKRVLTMHWTLKRDGQWIDLRR